jgi:rod shape-determining protein MreD
MPERCGIFLAATVGLFQDSLTASVLGTHVFAYTVAIGFTVLSYKRLRMFDVWQQAGFIFLLVGLEQMIEHWLSAANGYRQGGLLFLLSSVISAFIWPWLMIMLRSFRRRVGLAKKLI